MLTTPRRVTTFAAAICCLVLLATGAFGQSISGTLTGTVTDSSGAVIPGATVTVTNANSGDVRKTVSNNDGYFTVAALPAGSYTATVTAAGFQKYEVTGLAFNGSDKRNLDAVLQVGTANQAVEVISAQDIVTPTDSGEKSSVLNTQTLQNISVVGRSAAEFIKILPGMAQTGNGVDNRPGFSGEVIGINGNGDGGHQSALGYYSANGTPTNSMDITADGAHVSDPGCNCATPVNPNTDMIQEFKVLTSNFSAENSKGPVVLSSIAKSGTRDFHGEGYFYARHFALNSNDALFNATGVTKPENKYFFPGGNFGGPVILPWTHFNKNRDKLFFFTGYEYYYQQLDTGLLTANVPSAANKNGDFSNLLPGTQLVFPGTSTPIPGNIIPKSSIDPGGQVLTNLYPSSNSNGIQTGNNYVDALSLGQNSYQWLSRVDYSISDNTKLFVRYNLQNELQQFPVSLWWRPNPTDQVPYPTPIEAHNQSQSVSASLTHVFSPSLTNEFVFGYTYINFPNSFADPKKVDRTALGYPYQGLFKNGVKQIPSVDGWGNEVAFLFNPGGFEFANGSLFAVKHLQSYGDNLSKVWGTHTMKFGAYYEHVTNNQPSNNNSNGEVNFSHSGAGSSGNAYADMLLGYASGGFDQQNFNVLHNEAYNILEFFAQDSWKVTRRLTLDYGMRFSHLGQWYDLQGLGFAVWTPSTFVNDQNAFLPGISWNKRDKSIPLSGFPTRTLFFTPRFGMAWDVFGSGQTVVRGGWGAYRFHTPQSTDGLDAPTGSYDSSIGNPMFLSQIDKQVPNALSTFQSSQTILAKGADQEPLTYSYSFTISQRVMGSVLEASYVGNQTKYLYENVYHNVNAVPYGTLLNVPGANGVNINSYRPNSYYQSINVGTPDAYSNYNGLQVSFNRQRGRYNFLMNYTFSKTLGVQGGSGFNTTGTIPDTLNMNANYGPLAFDRRHIFNAAYSFELPSPMHDNRLLEGVVNGWQVSGITQLQSGVNLQFNNGSSSFNLNTGANTLANGDSITNRTIAGTDAIQLMPVLTCNPTSNLKAHQFINASCFSLPTPGHNGGYIEPELFGPAFFNSDLSLFKNFTFAESRKLQFRFSAYNFLNHPLYSFGHDNNLNLNFGSNGQVSNPLFGYATNKVGRRVIQLAVKFYF